METEMGVLDHSAGRLPLVAVFDSEGALLHINGEGRALLGYGVDDELSGTLLADYYPEIVYERRLFDAYQEAVAAGRWVGDIEMVTRDRRAVMTHHELEVRRRPDGSFERLIVTARLAGGSS